MNWCDVDAWWRKMKREVLCQEEHAKEWAGQPLGIHLHPSPLTVDDITRVKQFSKYIVMQAWKTEWPTVKISLKLLLENIKGTDIRVILRVEDPSVYSTWAKPGAKTDEAWFNAVYLPYLQEVLTVFNGPNAWAIQVYNEINLDHQFLIGSTGQKITANEMVLLLKRIRIFLDAHHQVTGDAAVPLMPAVMTYNSDHDWTDKLLDAGVLYQSGAFNLHFYAGYPLDFKCWYKTLSKKLGKLQVIVTEAGSGWADSKTKRIQALMDISQVCSDYLNVVAIMPYCWQHVLHYEKQDWGIKDTIIETFLNEVAK